MFAGCAPDPGASPAGPVGSQRGTMESAFAARRRMLGTNLPGRVRGRALAPFCGGFRHGPTVSDQAATLAELLALSGAGPRTRRSIPRFLPPARLVHHDQGEEPLNAPDS